MKITFLADIEARRESVPALGIGDFNKTVVYYSRSPIADELVAISADSIRVYDLLEELLPLGLKPIGAHPNNPFYIVCSRSDSGAFWRGVAVAKYRILIAEHRLLGQVFRYLYLSGMLSYDPTDPYLWKHLRLDWLLVTSAIASTGLIGCSLLWLGVGNYGWAILTLSLSLCGWSTVGIRRNQLIEQRDFEMREASLRALFRVHGIPLDTGEFQGCLLGMLDTNLVIATYRARELAKRHQESTHPCVYHNRDRLLSCAVHPDHQVAGKCNENCPSFTPKQDC